MRSWASSMGGSGCQSQHLWVKYQWIKFGWFITPTAPSIGFWGMVPFVLGQLNHLTSLQLLRGLKIGEWHNPFPDL